MLELLVSSIEVGRVGGWGGGSGDATHTREAGQAVSAIGHYDERCTKNGV